MGGGFMAEEENQIETGGEVAAETAEVVEPQTQETEPKADPAVEALLESDKEKSGDDGENSETETSAFKPNMAFKAGFYNKDSKQLEQKDYTIDPKFSSVMGTPEGEKLVRELHEKAYGLDSVKERFDEARTQNKQLATENRDYVQGVANLRKIYQGAAQTGNWHKLDKFFETLQIPQENILKYALAKVQLNEMPPEQQHAIRSQIDAENRAETLAQQQVQSQSQGQSQAAQLRTLQIEVAMNKPEVSALAKAFDERVGRTGAFEQAVRQQGTLAWHEGHDIPPNEAIKRVIENYGLKTANPLIPPAADGNAVVPPANAGLVQKPVSIIPNVQGRSTSPVKTPKPKSVDDLKKLYKEKYGS
jgi:hypothetical protein